MTFFQLRLKTVGKKYQECELGKFWRFFVGAGDPEKTRIMITDFLDSTLVGRNSFDVNSGHNIRTEKQLFAVLNRPSPDSTSSLRFMHVRVVPRLNRFRKLDFWTVPERFLNVG